MKHCCIKKGLLLLVVMVSVVGNFANPADGDNLYVLTKTSTQPMVFSLDNLDKITFTENGVNLWNTSWPTRYAYDNFRVMAFKEPTPNTILLKEVESADVSVAYDRQGDGVRVSSAMPIGAVIIYDLHGYLVASDRQPSSPCMVSMSHAPRGIYVVQVLFEGNVVANQKIVK